MQAQEKNKIPVVTLILLAVNILAFLYVEWNGSSSDTEYMIQMGAIYEPRLLEDHEYYRLITYFFLHFGLEHLANNMISLVLLGNVTENVLGCVRFTVLYFLSGILAGLISIVYNVSTGKEYVVSAGASGAIYGLMGAVLMLLIFESRRKKSRRQIPMYLLFIGLSLYSGMQDVSIDNAAHIGGFVTGLLTSFVMFENMEVKYED